MDRKKTSHFDFTSLVQEAAENKDAAQRKLDHVRMSLDMAQRRRIEIMNRCLVVAETFVNWAVNLGIPSDAQQFHVSNAQPKPLVGSKLSSRKKVIADREVGYEALHHFWLVEQGRIHFTGGDYSNSGAYSPPKDRTRRLFIRYSPASPGEVNFVESFGMKKISENRTEPGSYDLYDPNSSHNLEYSNSEIKATRTSELVINEDTPNKIFKRAAELVVEHGISKADYPQF